MTVAIRNVATVSDEVDPDNSSDTSSEIIVQSRLRCEQSGLDRGITSFRKISEEDLAQRIKRNRTLIDAASPHLKWIAAATVEARQVVCLTDCDGIVLQALFGDAESAPDGFEPGSDRSEAAVGTNGAGTAIASGQPVGVVRREHYCRAFHEWTSVAAPIRAGDGSIVGAIDATVHKESDSAQRLTLVAFAASQVERELAGESAASARGSDSTRIAVAGAEALRLHKLRDAELRNRETALAMAAHEIRNPLNVFALQLHTLLDWAQRDSGEDVASSAVRIRILQKALASTHKIARLLNDVTDISLSSKGKLQLQRSETDLIGVIREVVDRNEKIAEDSPPVILRGPEKLPGNWDRMRLDQVIANLLANAAKHSDGKPIDVIVTGDELAARIEVRDRGVGIAADRLDSIFEPFETTGLQSDGNFGLGLWIVNLITRSMGGSVSVSSVEGEGSCFTVDLPRR